MYFLCNNAAGTVSIYTVTSDSQIETLVNGLSLGPEDYGVFENLDLLPPDWESFPGGVTFTPGPTPTYGYELAGAKTEAASEVKFTNAGLCEAAADNLSAQLLSAQASIPEVDRIPEAQEALNSLNTLAGILESQLLAIDAATSIEDLQNITNPPTGILQTGRGWNTSAEDLNPSYYEEFNSVSLTEADTELYIPGTDTVIPYNPTLPTPYVFDSIGDCFTVGDYRVQIRVASTGMIIAEFVAPLTPSGNQEVPF